MVHALENQGPHALNAFEDQGPVGAAKTEIVFDRHVNLQVPRGVGAVVQVAFGILIKDIDRGRALLVVNGENREHRLDTPCSA